MGPTNHNFISLRVQDMQMVTAVPIEIAGKLWKALEHHI
jgi:hypothetical protein